MDLIFDKNITDVFFDLDHTLWDFDKNSEYTFRFIFDNEKINLSLKLFLPIYNSNNHYFWSLYRQDKISYEELRIIRLKKSFSDLKFKVSNKKIEKISEIYFKNLITFNFLMKDSIKLLKKLKKKYNLHIITNGFDKVQNKKINNSSLSFFFNSITTAEEAGFKKPNIEIFNFAMARANTKPTNSLMIGDSFDSDIIGSLNAGMKAIHFNSHAENDHNRCLIVQSLSQLIELIDN